MWFVRLKRNFIFIAETFLKVQIRIAFEKVMCSFRQIVSMNDDDSRATISVVNRAIVIQPMIYSCSLVTLL